MSEYNGNIQIGMWDGKSIANYAYKLPEIES